MDNSLRTAGPLFKLWLSSASQTPAKKGGVSSKSKAVPNEWWYPRQDSSFSQPNLRTYYKEKKPQKTGCGRSQCPSITISWSSISAYKHRVFLAIKVDPHHPTSFICLSDQYKVHSSKAPNICFLHYVIVQIVKQGSFRHSLILRSNLI